MAANVGLVGSLRRIALSLERFLRSPLVFRCDRKRRAPFKGHYVACAVTSKVTTPFSPSTTLYSEASTHAFVALFFSGLGSLRCLRAGGLAVGHAAPRRSGWSENKRYRSCKTATNPCLAARCLSICLIAVSESWRRPYTNFPFEFLSFLPVWSPS